MADVERQYKLKRDNRQKASQAETSQIAKDSAAKVAAIEKERKAAMSGLEDQAAHAKRQRQQSRADAAKNAQAELDEARKRLDDSLAKTKQAAAETGTEPSKSKGAPEGGKLPAAAQIAEAGKAAATAGTFNAFAVGGMATSGVQDRIAKATEKTARLIEKYAKRRGKPFVFTGADSPM